MSQDNDVHRRRARPCRVILWEKLAITGWIPPLTGVRDDFHAGATPQPEEQVTGKRTVAAWYEAKGALAEVPGFWTHLWSNFRDGVYMAAAILPSILAVGLIGLLLAKYTPIFDWLGWVFVPFTWSTQMAEPVLAGKAISLGIVEMFLPAIQAAEVASLVTRFVIGVVSVSQIIFFSALVPCIMATDIPITIWHLVVIWLERVVLTILIAAPLAHLLP